MVAAQNNSSVRPAAALSIKVAGERWPGTAAVAIQLRRSAATISLYRKNGCPAIGGLMLPAVRRVVKGVPAYYHDPSVVRQIRDALATKQENDFDEGKLWLSAIEAHKFFNVDPKELRRRRGARKWEDRIRFKREKCGRKRFLYLKEDVERIHKLRYAPLPPRALFIRDFAQRLRVSTSAVYRWINSGCRFLGGEKLPCDRIRHGGWRTVVFEDTLRTVRAAMSQSGRIDASDPTMADDDGEKYIPGRAAEKTFGFNSTQLTNWSLHPNTFLGRPLRRIERVEPGRALGKGRSAWFFSLSDLKAIAAAKRNASLARPAPLVVERDAEGQFVYLGDAKRLFNCTKEKINGWVATGRLRRVCRGEADPWNGRGQPPKFLYSLDDLKAIVEPTRNGHAAGHLPGKTNANGAAQADGAGERELPAEEASRRKQRGRPRGDKGQIAFEDEVYAAWETASGAGETMKGFFADRFAEGTSWRKKLKQYRGAATFGTFTTGWNAAYQRQRRSGKMR